MVCHKFLLYPFFSPKIFISQGILTIFTWRILAKSILHIILPPIFRLLSQSIRLPHRRFYTPATEYKNVPSEFHLFHSSSIAGGREDRGAGTFGLHPIPSVIDLPTSAGMGVEVGGFGSGVEGVSKDLKMRVFGSGGVGNGEKMGNGNRDDKESAGKDGQISDVKHYDADGEFTSLTRYSPAHSLFFL